MNHVYRDIFKAMHEGKWLSIEYKNKQDQITKYWIGIRDLDVRRKSLKVEGLHLGQCSIESYDSIYIDSILSSKVVEGSYCERNESLLEDIYRNPHKYKVLFDNTVNLKILNYLEDCNRMDATPYKEDFELIRYLDRESFRGEAYELSEEQFRFIVKNFQFKTEQKSSKNTNLRLQHLALNILSIHMPKGLYVLAYRRLELDVKRRVLKPEEDITICTEFTIDGRKESIRRFLDAEEFELLKDFEANQEAIKDHITGQKHQVLGVDDMPYIIGLGMDIILDLHKEYSAITDAYHKGEESIPIKAFFGELVSRPIRSKAYPIALLNRKVNLDQLLAIDHAMKYPVAYIQGPPGTGKTSTIINTICTAFFNEKTVLFSSYNNHPIDGVFEKLSTILYQGKRIPFPIIRLGNYEKVVEALKYMKAIYQRAEAITVYDKTLDRNKDDRTKRAKRLSDLLKRHEEVLDLKERDETIKDMLTYNESRNAGSGHKYMETLPYQANLGGQASTVRRRIQDIGNISDEEARQLITIDMEGEHFKGQEEISLKKEHFQQKEGTSLEEEHSMEEFKKYLYYTSAKYIKRIAEPRNQDLKEIIFLEDEKEQAEQFTKYLSQSENIKKLLRIFPIVVTTCISAHRLGEPKGYFDMVIMDEASQCNTAVSLVPIIRGSSLMLVGDPQQLNPVILLDEAVNQKLKRKYKISDDYDYCRNSIYKTYLACDAVSDEVLLRYHYRCHKKIIDFNNKKYYHSKLQIRSDREDAEPLVYVNVKDSTAEEKNTAPREAAEIMQYISRYKGKSIGIITPFVNQKKEIERYIQERGFQNVSCGTVHAFQGDEKDIILFSTAITDKTHTGTYEWLKSNKELINVATSRAKEKLVIFSSTRELERLHNNQTEDDLYELIKYVKTNGTTQVTQKTSSSRALGVKPFSTATEEAFMAGLNHALENIWLSQSRFTVQKEVAISHVFQENYSYNDLFYSGRFDFVVYEKNGKQEIPVLAIELDGKEHFVDEVVKERDRKKEAICREHQLELIRVENSYARRYQHIKAILINYFSGRRI